MRMDHASASRTVRLTRCLPCGFPGASGADIRTPDAAAPDHLSRFRAHDTNSSDIAARRQSARHWNEKQPATPRDGQGGGRNESIDIGLNLPFALVEEYCV
jgi:hypothetical protein